MKSIITLFFLIIFSSFINAQEKWSIYTTEDGLANNIVWSIAIDAQGNKWFATWGGGLSKFNDTTWFTYNKSNGLADSLIRSVAIDEKGVLWIGTGSNGVYKIQNDSLYHYTMKDGLVFFSIRFISIDQQNHKWISTPLGVSEFDDETWTSYTKSSGLCNDMQNNIVFDAQGNKWIANNAGRINVFDGITFNTIYPKGGTGISSMAIDKHGVKWLATSSGVMKYNDTTWTKYTENDGLVENYVWSIAIDMQENKWFGTSNGVSKFDGKTWTNYDTILGHAIGTVWSIAIDPQGNKWFGTYDGVIKMEDGGAGPLIKNVQKGVIFVDINENGIRDKDESNLSGQTIAINSNYTVTQANGMFYTTLENGNYTIKYIKHDASWQLTTDSVIHVNVSDSITLDTIFFGVKSMQSISNVAVCLSGSATRVGFISQYWIDYSNEGTITEDGSITLNLDTLAGYISSIPLPDTIINNQLKWNFNNLLSGEKKQIYLLAQMPDFNAYGDTLVSAVHLFINNNDIDSLYNSDTIKQIITGSYDPNDKQEKEGVGDEGYMLFNTPLTYTIRFQNTGTDTAFNVNIRDSLNINLDVSTLEIIASSHPVTLDLRGTNEATFHFKNIMLPDSNVNKTGSNGFVKYSIKPKVNVTENTIVNNKAYIFFDFNPAIVTNETKNTYVKIIPSVITSIINNEIETKQIFSVYPNPVTDMLIVNSDHLIVNTSAIISIVNTLGQIVFVNFCKLSTINTINISGLQNGIYFIKLQTTEGIYIKKIVKE